MGGVDPIVLPPAHNVFGAILGIRDKLKNWDLVRLLYQDRRTGGQDDRLAGM